MDTMTLRLRQIVRSGLADRAGETLGRVEDLIVRLNGGRYPPVTGVQARIGGRNVFVPIAQIAHLTAGKAQLSGETVNLGQFERRSGEVLLKHDILGHALIDVETGRLIRATDLELTQIDGEWRVTGIDASPRALLARVLRRSSNPQSDASGLIDWTRVEPFVGHVPTAQLRLPLRRLRRLHPAQIADLVEAASHDEGEEIISAVHADPELEADVFEELDTEHQIEFLQGRSDVEAATVLGSMNPDDAADLIGDLDQSRRASILARLPAKQQAKVRSLLAHNPSTAGGLMTTDFFAVHQNRRIDEVLADVRGAAMPVLIVHLLDDDNLLVGSIALDELLRAPGACEAREILEPTHARLPVDADLTDVALLMADYNLIAVPVVDSEDHLVGVISVDDVLETLIPEDWRRRVEAGRG